MRGPSLHFAGFIWAAALIVGVPVHARQGGSTDEAEVRGETNPTGQIFRDALRAAAPAIVRIDTIGGAQPVQPEGDADSPRGAAGFRTADGPTTGVIWSSDGYILSSTFNFVRDPSIITVSLADGRRLVGRLVARDHQSRLALLKVDATDLPLARWRSEEQLRAGQWALTAGFGYGSQEPAISVGIISGLNRMSGQAVQTDAKTSPANYGGPLLDVEGCVLGICVPLGAGEDQFAGVESYDSGIGFALHRDHIQRRLPRLMKGEDLKRGLLGLSLDLRDPIVGEADPAQPPTTQQASQPATRPAGPRGLRIIEAPRGPAAAAELQKGDEIMRIDEIATPRILDFRRAIARKAAGESVKVTFRREGETDSVSMKLASAEELKSQATTQPTSRPD